jgi:ABC-type sugar transport system ATPase subunit
VAVIAAGHLIKRFPGVLAVDDVSLAIAPGEVLALLGQNGAGKSTLIQILAGVHPHGSYEGTVTLVGRPFHPADVAEAEAAGVALVPQELNVAPDLTVAETMFLNAEPTRWGLLDKPMCIARARDALADFGLKVDAEARVGSLDLSTQQLVIIARALSKNARLLILDEPTAALTEEEARRLFAHVRALTGRGMAAVFVSHRLSEVFAVSDRIVVMRDGRIRGSHATGDVSREQVVAEMVGGIAGAPLRPGTGTAIGAPLLEVEQLEVFDPLRPGRRRVEGISFAVGRGETVGLFGLLGAGCIEAALAVYGAWEGEVAGRILVDGRRVDIADPVDAVGHGMGLVPQDRRRGLIAEHSVHHNVAMASLPAFSPRGFLDVGVARRRTEDLKGRLAIRAPSIDTLLSTLSGGNQQKVQVARWLAAAARILILIDPTRGVDVGARAEIKRVWAELAAAGHAILIASTDTEELAQVADRVLVMRHGRLAGEVRREDLSEQRLLRLAADV